MPSLRFQVYKELRSQRNFSVHLKTVVLEFTYRLALLGIPYVLDPLDGAKCLKLRCKMVGRYIKRHREEWDIKCEEDEGLSTATAWRIHTQQKEAKECITRAGITRYALCIWWC